VPPRMFQDLVESGLVRAGRGRARAVPVSLVFHGLALAALVVLPTLSTDLPPVSAAPPPPIPTFQRVQVVEIAPQVPPLVPAGQSPRHRTPQVEPALPAAGTGPALPPDPSRLGEGSIDPDAPAICLSNCTGGGDPVGIIAPGLPTDGGGEGPPVLRRAGRDVTPPAKLGGSQPAYPELAKRARVQGDVVIECTIDPSGRVVDVTVTKSIPLLDDAALDAVRTWRYRPTLVDGVPVPILMTVTVRFRLH